jgi:hypothetical protein
MTRRLSSTLSALATARHIDEPAISTAPSEPLLSGAPTESLSAIGGDVEAYLRKAAQALRTGTPLAAYHRHDAAMGALPALLAARMARTDRQLAILGEAVARNVSSAG